MGDASQVWHLDRDAQHHRVEASGSPSHHVRWLVDDELVAEKKAWEDKLTLTPGERDALGTVVVRFSTMGRPRRATMFRAGDDVQALAGVGGEDLVPEPGSVAAAYEDRIRLHPTRHSLIATAGGVATVVVPILIGLLLVRLAVLIDWPDLSFPNLPDLPDIPWPDLPSLPLPDLPALPDVRVPGWLRWILDKATYVWPVVVAYVIARAEIRRRREQDRRRTETQDER